MIEEPFETISKEGLGIHGRLFIPEGEGPFPCVVLLHGFGATYAEGMYLAILRGLAVSGILGVGFQFGGEGEPPSHGEFITITYPRCIAETDAVLDFVMRHPLVDETRVGLGGHSMGGIITLATASQRRDVKALAIVSTSWDPQGEIIVHWDTTPEEWRRIGYVDLSELDVDWGIGARKVKYHFYESWGAYDPQKIVPALPQPTMVAYGEKDALISVEKAQRYFASLTSEKRLVSIKNADHIFTNPGALEDLVDTISGWFVERLGLSRAGSAGATVGRL